MQNVHKYQYPPKGKFTKIQKGGNFKFVKESMKLNWNFQRGGGVVKLNYLPQEGYGYFLELVMTAAP